MELWILWLIAFLLLAGIEVMTQWLTTFCFAVGCLVALICALCGVSPLYQLLLLAISALASFFVFAPYFQRLHQRKGKSSRVESNMDAMMGRVAHVTQNIPANSTGRVKIDGDNWQARSYDGQPIAENSAVQILDYDSIILIVKQI